MHIDDVTLQLFADGELTENASREILRDLDDDPTQWRRLALAFVELQIWNEAISIKGPSADTLKTLTPSSPVATRTSNRPTVLARWVTLATGLLLGLGLGYGASNSLRSPSQQVIAEASRKPSQDSAQADSGASRLEEAVSRSALPVPDSLRLRLLRSGYYLDEVHTATPVKLPTGEEIEIPVREVTIQYLGHVAFQ